MTNQVKGTATAKSRGGTIPGVGSLGVGGAAGTGGRGKGNTSVSDCRALLFWVIRRLTTDQDTGVLLQAAEVRSDSDSREWRGEGGVEGSIFVAYLEAIICSNR